MTANDVVDPGRCLERTPRQDEIGAIISGDGKTCIAVVKRSDGLLWCFEDTLSWDQENDVYYWTRSSDPCSGLYESWQEAEHDVRSGFDKK
jgi:hypothetical protein